MKNRIKSLLIAGVLFATIGCSKDQTVNKYDPSSEDAMTAYFAQKGVSDEFSTEMTGDQKMYVEVYRQNNQGELTVGIDYSLPGDSRGFFSFPKDVTFKDGDFKTTMEVIVHDVETLAKGATYNATATIGSHHEFEDVVLPMPDKMQRAKSRSVSIAEKYKSVTVSIALALDWQPAYILKDPTKLLEQKPAGTEDAEWYKMQDGKPMPLTATWQDAWGMASNTEDLAIQRATGTNVFRVVNFGEGGVNIIFMVDANVENKVTYDGEKYYRSILTPQFAGVLYQGADDIYISDFPSYTGSLTYDQAPCIWDGKNTFRFTLYWYVPALGGGFTDPNSGFTDLITFSTGVAAEPEPKVAISYLGVNTSSTGVKTHSLKYEPNGDAAKYLATVLKENLNPDIDMDALKAEVIAFLAKNGITEDNPEFADYFNQYFSSFYAEKVAIHEEEMLEKLAAIRDKIEAGTYKSDVPVLEYSAKNEDAWNLGNEDGLFTAVAFSYDESGAVKGIDYSVFLYNPEGDPAGVQCDIDFGAGNEGDYTDYSMGYFGDNSLQIYFEAEADDITAISYVLLTAKEFADAGLTDNSSKEVLRAYVEENGRSLSAAALKQVNHQDPNVSYYVAYLAAKAATDYKLITSISNADATKVEINSAKTEAAETPVDLKCALALKADATHYTHTSVYAEFTGKHIVGGTYVMVDATSKVLANFISIDKDGKVTMKDGVTDANMVELIEANGSAFSTGETATPANSHLALMNKGGKAGIYLKATPEIRYIVLACADYDGAGAKKWTSAVISSDFAPAVVFSQTVVAKGKAIEFNWKSAAQLAGIFQVKQVVYALVPKSALTAAGVDMANISNLNDFDARSAQATTDAERDAIEAQRKNATKISEVLSANAKYFKGDAAAAINSATGVTKQFPNVNAGEYALIGLANDTYNTGLQVSPVTIQ